MAALGALVFLLAACWASAYPSVQLADFPENVRGGASRIVSGWEAKEGQIPHQISLRMVANDGFVFGCGATVIHNEWALTAAHCTANRVTIILRFGGIDLSRPSLILETTDYYNHPLYIEALAGIVQPHDIGLLKFNRFVEYTDVIKPIRMQSSIDKNTNYNTVVLEASGWGRTWTNGSSPQILNWVYLTGVSNVFCRNLFGDLIIDSTICASAYNVSSQSTCQGDSGGPLVVKDQDGKLTQVGISSFVSSSGCHTDFPAGFIRPGHYHNWYTEVTGINFDWDFSEVPTVAPEVSTVTPEVPTVAPEVPTVAPEVPTVAPEVPTVAPEVPTVAPEVPTVAPEVPTIAPEVPTVAPEVPTVAPEVPTVAPEVPTVAPEVEASPSTTRAPEVEEEDNGNGEKDSEEEEDSNGEEDDSDSEGEDDNTSESDEEDTSESEEDSKDSESEEDSKDSESEEDSKDSESEEDSKDSESEEDSKDSDSEEDSKDREGGDNSISEK